MSNVWDEYDKWESAFCDVVYGGEYSHQPVFLDVEDPLLVKVARKRGLDLTAGRAESKLVADVRRTLMLGAAHAGYGVFSRHRGRLDIWRYKRRAGNLASSAAPPIVALLAVFARAAELMGRDDRYTSSAYFPRLHQLLHIDTADEGRITNAYRRDSERMWGALNVWLDSMGGTRGVPTAETIGHRYVGIALSQALMREADRQLLPTFFVSKDLEPGLKLAQEDMAAYLESWVKAGHGSNSLKNLMKNAAGKKVLAEAAALALVRWDGTLPGENRADRIVRPPLLTARISRSGLGGVRRVQPGFALRGSVLGSLAIPRRWVVLSAPGPSKPQVELDTLTDRLVAPDLLLDIDGASLITGQLRLAPAGGNHSHPEVARKPQPVVVLTYLEEAGLFVEVERARLLEPHMVLANAGARTLNGAPMFDLESLLKEVARPGFTKMEGVPGIPDGWVVYRDVVIAHTHDRSEFALDPLRPSQTSVLTVSGGFRMPGHVARWHADVALDILATASGARKLEVQLVRLEDDAHETVVATWATEKPELAGATAGRGLAPGHYRAVMSAVGTNTRDARTSVATFSVCTSDDPRVRAKSAAIAYLPGSILSGLGATPLVDGGKPGGDGLGAIRGAEGGCAGIVQPAGVMPGPVWWTLTSASTEQTILAEPAAPDSCAITGAHKEHIETHHKGMRRDRGVCERCGRVKLYLPTGRPKRVEPVGALSVRQPLEHLGSVEGPRAIQGETLLDAVVWLGGGSPHEIAHLVRQVLDSALTVDEIVRVLECLGHIDVRRNASSFTLEEWAVSPRALAGLEDGAWFVAGSWGRSALKTLEATVQSLGGTLLADEDGWLPRRRLVGLDDAAASEVGRGLDAAVVPNAGRALLGSLPPLSVVASSLPRTSASGIFDAEWFNPAAAEWTRVESIGRPGAYCLRKGFVRTYLYRSQQDVDEDTAIRATSQTVKHLASRERPLLGYEPDNHRLFVPLGADLPGVYGRALSLMSGRSPARVRGKPLLVYESVGPDVASGLVGLLKE